MGSNKTRVTIRLDDHIIAFFKKDGSMWQTRLNDALQEWLLQQYEQGNWSEHK